MAESFSLRFIRPALALILAGTIIGCASRQPGRLEAIKAPAPRDAQICLVRGFADWYSEGVDLLASELRRQGLGAQSFSEEQWQQLADRLIETRAGDAHDPRRKRGSLVLIGYSWGADDVIAIARDLARRNVAVDLLISIDPVTPDPVPGNVARCVNFYEPNGVLDMLPFLRGIRVEREQGDSAPLDNVNIRSDQAFAEPDTSHATIASNAKIHRAIVALVRQTCALDDAAQ